MFQVKRGCAIGAIGSTELEFETTISCFKNDVGCVEVSRTGQAADKSLTVELKYRDFPNFSLKMSNYAKANLIKFEGNLNLNSYFLYYAYPKACDLILSDQFLFLLCDKKMFGIAKDNFGDFYIFTDEISLYTGGEGKNKDSKHPPLLSSCHSANGKMLILDIFCPDFSTTTNSKSIDFERKILGVKNIVGLNELSILSRFSVDGQEYVRISDRLCVEVTP